MTKFEKPGKRDWDYPEMAKEAGQKALADAGVAYECIEQAVAGYVYGDSTCGQRALYEIGLTGIPIYNVNNNCSTGSTALYLAKQLVEGGLAECVMAVGFEKMERGSLGSKFTDRTNPMEKHMTTMMELREFAPAPPAPQMFGNAGLEHMEKYGTSADSFARVAHKNHKHSVNNPYAQFRKEFSLDAVKESRPIYGPLTMLQCCPTSDGAGAAIVASEAFVRRHGLESQAVEIIGMAMTTDTRASFEDSCIRVVGADMTARAAQIAYRQAGVNAQHAQVVELHDCFSCNELLTYEALGLCAPGDGGKLIDDGQVTYGGKWVVNPSGGLISKGHPLGATGLAQCSELCWQLRGMCGNRQVPDAKVALQHNIGLGGAVVVTLYRLGFPNQFKPLPTGAPNPAIDADAVATHRNNNVTASPASAKIHSSL
jgi:acetyl-CoA acetyltransferase